MKKVTSNVFVSRSSPVNEILKEGYEQRRARAPSLVLPVSNPIVHDLSCSEMKACKEVTFDKSISDLSV